VEVWCREGTFVHAEGAFCGCGEGIATACPRRGCFLWKSGAGSGHLSTQRVLFVEVWCREWAFVHRRGHFCGCGEKIVAACPRRRCFLWKFGAGRGLLSTDRGVFVDAEGDLLNYFVIGKLNS